MVVSEQENYRVEPYQDNPSMELSSINRDESSLTPVTNEERKFENMSSLFPDDDLEELPLKDNQYVEGNHTHPCVRARRLSCWMFYVLFIPILILVAVFATITYKKNHSEQTPNTKSEDQQKLDTIKKWQERQEKLNKFNPDAIIDMSPTYHPTCVYTRNYWMRVKGYTEEVATIKVIDEYPVCVKND